MNIKLIDNFLNEHDLKEIQSLNLTAVKKNEVKVYHNSIDKNNNVKSECINSDTIIRLHRNYHKKAINVLRELNSAKIDLYEYSEFHIIETGANCQFPIHDDTPNKLLSGVIYINPESNSGTKFYKTKKGEGEKTVEWKINRGVFFSRKERETWHSYKGDGNSNRIALVYNLMTTRIKEVFEIEKKSYLIGNFRYKINPYIYKFFKFTI